MLARCNRPCVALSWMSTLVDHCAAGFSQGKPSIQYYVHYVDYDRRLDDWVNGEKLSTLETSRSLVRQNSGEGGDKV